MPFWAVLPLLFGAGFAFAETIGATDPTGAAATAGVVGTAGVAGFAAMVASTLPDAAFTASVTDDRVVDDFADPPRALAALS